MEGEQLLYKLLPEMGTTYLSVAHRVCLVSYHRMQLTLLGEGRWELTSIDLDAVGPVGKVVAAKAARLISPDGFAFE